jgi:hypothetical protein
MRELKSQAPQIGSKANLMETACNYDYPVHLLGVPDVEEFITRELPLAIELRVRGVDTSLAFALGARGKVLMISSTKEPLGDVTQYERLSTQGRRLSLLNTHILTDWVENECVLPGVPTRLIRYTASRWLKFFGEGFATVRDVMSACRFPEGKYVIVSKTKTVEEYVTSNRKISGKEVSICY